MSEEPWTLRFAFLPVPTPTGIVWWRIVETRRMWGAFRWIYQHRLPVAAPFEASKGEV
jgi:hypothetical protein